MSDIRCAMCGEPMHRYGFPRDADRHEPSMTACLNSLRATRDEMLALVDQAATDGDVRAEAYLWQRELSGQGRRYPEAFTDEGPVRG